MNKDDLKKMRDTAQENIDKFDNEIDKFSVELSVIGESQRSEHIGKMNKHHMMREIYFSQLQNIKILEELNDIRDILNEQNKQKT